MHVLVIEDDREHAQFIEKVLAEARHSVETVDDGAGGLSRAREDQFDALVVDRMLPEKPGLHCRPLLPDLKIARPDPLPNRTWSRP